MSSHARAATGVVLVGNFVMACAVMVVPGMLDALAADLRVSVPQAGQLLSLASLALCLGAPALAALTSRVDRRLLLVASLLAVALGHAACALAPDHPTLLAIRPWSVLGAAVFTPQGAAVVGTLVPPERRATAVTTVFLGWSAAAVVAMPLGSLVAGTLGWRAAFVLIAVAALLCALAVWRAIPRGLQVPALSLQSWLQVARDRRLVAILAATALWCTGQFIALGYIAPTLRHAAGVPLAMTAALMAVQGVAGLAGATWLAREVGRVGAGRSASLALGLILCGLLLWGGAVALRLPAAGFAVVMAVWGLGSFAFVSSQQARLAMAAPALASASIALNSASLYAGQAAGAWVGGVLVGHVGYGALGFAGAAAVALALGVSLGAEAARSSNPGPAPGGSP